MDKKTQSTLFGSDKNYWETPQSFFNQLNDKYCFTLDAAASGDNYKCERYYSGGGSRKTALRICARPFVTLTEF